MKFSELKDGDKFVHPCFSGVLVRVNESKLYNVVSADGKTGLKFFTGDEVKLFAELKCEEWE